MAEHNAGKGAKYTKGCLPLTLIYTETAPTRSAALKREAASRRWIKRPKGSLARLMPILSVQLSASKVSNTCLVIPKRGGARIYGVCGGVAVKELPLCKPKLWLTGESIRIISALPASSAMCRGRFPPSPAWLAFVRAFTVDNCLSR